MKLLAIFLTTLVVIQGVPLESSFDAFMQWIHDFNKVYTSQIELALRYKNFQVSVDRVNMRRQKHFEANGESGDHVYGLTKFSDLSQKEFKTTYLGFKPTATAEQRRAAPVSYPISEIVPDTTVDWRAKGAVTPVKDQGQCGSCWAFSATEELESMWYMAGNPLTKLSVQQTVSCDKVDGGCGGGDTVSAYQYMEKQGVEDQADYPYSSGNGNTGRCKFDKSDVAAYVSNFTYATPPCFGGCSSQDEDTLASNLAQQGPVSICVDAESWNDYTGGVMRSDCPHGYGDLDHCVQLVGYDKDATTPYWIVRNSWNTDWGEDGYIFLEIGKNLCGIADEATIVVPGSK